MDANLTAAKHARIVSLLEESRDDLLAILVPLTSAQWSFQPDPETWTPALIGEHLMLAETTLLAQAKRALANPPNPDWQTATAEKLELVAKVMPTRRGKVKTPPSAAPAGQLSKEEILREFQRRRSESLEFVRSLEGPVKSHTADHFVKTLGTLNVQHWVMIIGFHTQRHIAQLNELRAHPEFPA